MNKHKKPLALYLILASLLSSAAVILRTVACFTRMDYQFGYFTDKAIINISGTVLAILSAVTLTYLIIGPKESLRASFATPITYIPSGLVAVSLLFVSVGMFTYAKETYTVGSAIVLPRATCYATSVLAIPSAIHFLLNAFFDERKCEPRAWFSIFTVVFLTSFVVFLYFDPSTPINAPNKLTDQCALQLASIFFLYESRISLGRSLWRGYVSFGIIAASLLAYASIPALVVYFVKKELLSFSLELSLLMLMMCVFITMRMVSVLSLRSESDNGGVGVITDYAVQRMAQVREKEAMYRNIYATRQMTIADLADFDESEPIDNGTEQADPFENGSSDGDHDKLDEMQITIDDTIESKQDEDEDNTI